MSRPLNPLSSRRRFVQGMAQGIAAGGLLSATAARGLDCQALLDPLQRDADPQVRRLVKEVLRRLSPGRDAPAGTTPARDELPADSADEPAARVAGAQGS